MSTIKITGKVNSAICYAKVVEEEALDQIKRMCDSPMSEGSKIRIMPDVHSGKGCTIGTTMTITDKVVPNVVGVDIGCGMLTVNLGKIDIDFKKLDEVSHYIPSGTNVWKPDDKVPNFLPWDETTEVFDITNLACYDELQNVDRQFINGSMGQPCRQLRTLQF